MRLLKLTMAAVFACCIAWAATDISAATIAVNFAADEPTGNRSDVLGPAGVDGTDNWNNVDLNIGEQMNLTGTESDGTMSSTAASVTWNSNNTWASGERGEENNSAPAGDDRNLMLGYLDTTDTTVTTVDFDGLGSFFQGGYLVRVYVQGGVNGRGGTYTIGEQTQDNVTSGAFDGTYILGATGNYLEFSGVTGNSFQLTGQATTAALFRGPINAVEIIGESSTAIEGDVNLDEMVDILDYEIIRDNFSTNGGRELGDLDFSGMVGISDFRIWKNAFNAAAGGGAVPEPATTSMCVLGMMLLALHVSGRRCLARRYA